MDSEFFGATDLERLTGTKARTWRYWASIGKDPRASNSAGVGARYRYKRRPAYA